MNSFFNRRPFLNSFLASIALPAFESLSFADQYPNTDSKPPKRLLFTSMGWGVTEETWFPNTEEQGKDYTLSPALKALEKHKQDFSVIQGLSHQYFSDGHWGSTMWLTGANRFAQAGMTFHNSVSADQVAAEQFGKYTRYNSLQFNSGEPNINGSGHGPGLSLAWDRRGKPVGGQNGPLDAYRRLFTKGTVSKDETLMMLNEKRSILDTVTSNAKYLHQKINQHDQDKLDEYLSGIRDIETRLSKEEAWLDRPRPQTNMKEPKEFKEGKGEIMLMHDLMVAALQTDSTRVITFRQPVRTFLPSIGIDVHQHDMSHYHGKPDKTVASKKRDLESCKLLSRFIDKLKATKEKDGSSLFDHTTLAYGSNLRTGHNLHNVPIIVAGLGSGLKLGENIVLPEDTPLNNLWLSILKGSGVKVEKHGDSTGVLKQVLV